jgi:hypothetical protein
MFQMMLHQIVARFLDEFIVMREDSEAVDLIANYLGKYKKKLS